MRVKLNQARLANRREKTHKGTEDSWEKGLETGLKVLNISVFGTLWEFWILVHVKDLRQKIQELS